MAPIDSAPHGAEIAHPLPEPRYPEPRPGGQSDEPARGQPHAEPGPDGPERPALPEHPAITAADLEDEEADPVIDDGPGIADGAAGPRKQKG